MKRFLLSLLIAVSALMVFPGVPNDTLYVVFSDTIKGDSTKVFDCNQFRQIPSIYSKKWVRESLFNPTNCKIMIKMDTVALETADSVATFVKVYTKRNGLSWSPADSVMKIATDSLYLMLIYDLPARTADATGFCDSMKFFLDVTNIDPTGNILKVELLFGE